MNERPEIDKYIGQSAEFAKPILNHLRALVHQACPDVTEVIKWSFPNFEYKGQILCSMASFHKHSSFGFWLGAEMPDPDNILEQVGQTAMGYLGKIISLEQLPSDEILIKYIREAMSMVDRGVKKSTVKSENSVKKVVRELEIPQFLLDALEQNDAAKATFEKFSNSCKKEYVEWLLEAKTETTRQKRLAEALLWMSEGKIRNWKYVK
jgi:uncharacterized protein YdeI (YjbR/CyaY-like superfamily)